MIKKKIIEEIHKSQKGISLQKFIDICLYDDGGYYKNLQTLGKLGDYTTAPEISQLFGEILGLYIFYIWKKKYNSSFNLIELGPGNGTLLIDILRITKNLSNIHKKINIHLVEKNNFLITKQQKNVLLFNLNHLNINWNDNFSKIKLLPSIIIANEFFDCFPIRQFQQKNNKWYEKFINYNQKKEIFYYENFLVEDLILLKELSGYEDNKIAEISEQREKYFAKICNFIKKTKGTIIIIDYGYFDLPNNFTLQTLYNHKTSNLLDNIGKQDISSLVNFKKLIEIARKHGLKVDTFSNQKDFLVKNGILERKKNILIKSNKKQKDDIELGCNKLINEKYMGNIFKFLILSNVEP